MNTSEASGQVHARFRIGLLLDSFVVPRWVQCVIREICSGQIANLVLVVRNAECGAHAPSLVDDYKGGVSHLLYRSYRRLDDRLFGHPVDNLGLVNVEEILAKYPVLEVHLASNLEGRTFLESDVQRISAYNLDVALCLGFRELRSGELKIAQYGVWAYDLGVEILAEAQSPGFWEVVEGIPVTASGLCLLGKRGEGGRTIYRSFTSTDRRSVRRNLNHIYAKNVSFFIRKLVELRDDDADALVGISDINHWPRPRFRGIPGNLRMSAALLGLGARYAADKCTDFFSPPQWQVAIQRGGNRFDPSKLEWIAPPKDRYWADPFPVTVGDRCFIFVEEYVYAAGKGHLSVIKLDRDGRWDQPVPVVQRDYHLSYPFLFEWRGEFFLVPESSQNRTVQLYRCVSFPWEWEPCELLLEGVNAVDSTFIEVDGRWWMFANVALEGLRNWDELCLFYADRPSGPWTPHRRNPVKSDVRSTRPAGRLFWSDGHLHRPAQDCSKRYGYALSMQRISRLNTREYRELEVGRILPGWTSNVLGIHTWNPMGHLIAVDALVRVPRFGWR
jgi:hypothetical protein